MFHLLNKEAPQPSFLGTAVGLKVCWKNEGIPLNHVSFRDRKFGFSVVLLFPHPHGKIFYSVLQHHYGHYITDSTAKPMVFSEKVFNTPFIDKAPEQVYTDNISYANRS